MSSLALSSGVLSPNDRAGAPLPPTLQILHEHSDHYSMQCTKPMTLEGMFELLHSFVRYAVSSPSLSPSPIPTYACLQPLLCVAPSGDTPFVRHAVLLSSVTQCSCSPILTRCAELDAELTKFFETNARVLDKFEFDDEYPFSIE